jgi:excisionase family DNA binding protein
MSKTSRVPDPVERLVYTVDEARSVLRLSRSSIYLLMKQRKIKYFHILDSRRIPRSEIERIVSGAAS